MKTIQITVTGRTPLLLNRFTDESQMSASSGTRSSIQTDSEAANVQAEKGLYKDENGVSGIPGPNLFRCFIDAGKFFKVGKSKMTTVKTSLIPAAVQINETFIPIKSEHGWKVDTRPVRIPATGGRILRHRPCYDDWSLTFSVDLDESIISESTFRDVVDDAGRKIGLGDFRPDCKGPYGRFNVDHWESKNEA